MCTIWTDLDVTTVRLQNQGYFQEVYCNTADHCFCIINYFTSLFSHNLWCCNTHYIVNSLEITFILQPARSDVKIGPDRAEVTSKSVRTVHMEIGYQLAQKLPEKIQIYRVSMSLSP